MLRRLLGAAGTVVLAATAVAATSFGTTMAAHADVPGTADRLHSGESTTSGLESASHSYLLILESGSADFIQLGIGGTLQAAIWSTNTPPRKANDLRLTMQTDGDLVLKSLEGQTVWASHTSGAGNTFVIQNDGNLVIVNAANQVIWQTHTGPAILDRGSVLASGHALTFTPPGYTSRTRLIMQTNGDLVLYWGGRAVWTSHTKVPGSRLMLQHNGNLVIFTPDNRSVWQSGTAGFWPAGLMIELGSGWIRPGVWYPADRGYLQLFDTSYRTKWIRPVG